METILKVRVATTPLPGSEGPKLHLACKVRGLIVV
jgi:hypothetical protein